MDDLTLALHLADIADDLVGAEFLRQPVPVTRKPDGSPVSAADIAVEFALREELRAARPGDGVLGEETAGSSGAVRTWIIDPVDHTSNFVRGIPDFATLIALADDGKTQVGVVSAPALGRRWWAARGLGAFTADGQPIRVSAVADLSEAYLSFAALHLWQQRGHLPGLVKATEHARYVTGAGGFWAQMMVAEGRIEASLDPWGELWDVAPGQIIVEEAGGRFSDLGGKPRPDQGCAIMTNGLLHQEILAILTQR